MFHLTQFTACPASSLNVPSQLFVLLAILKPHVTPPNCVYTHTPCTEHSLCPDSSSFTPSSPPWPTLWNQSSSSFLLHSPSPYCLLQSPRTFSYIHLSFYYESYFYPKTLRRSPPPLKSAVHFASQSHMFIGTLRRLLPRPTLTEPIRPGRPEPPGDTTVLLKD